MFNEKNQTPESVKIKTLTTSIEIFPKCNDY